MLLVIWVHANEIPCTAFLESGCSRTIVSARLCPVWKKKSVRVITISCEMCHEIGIVKVCTDTGNSADVEALVIHERPLDSNLLLSYDAVTLCRWSAKQTIPLSVLVWDQTKVFGLGISAWLEVGRERRSESWTKELEEGSWRRVTRVTSRHRTAERQFGMREGPDQWLKSGQDRLAFQ